MTDQKRSPPPAAPPKKPGRLTDSPYVEMPEVKNIEGIPHLLLPPGWAQKPLGELRARPKRISRTVMITSMEKLNAYCYRYSDESSSLFSSAKASAITCILDYHLDSETPGWCEHQAILQVELTEEMRKWKLGDGEWMAHKDFARFMRDQSDQLTDIAGAKKADMLEISRTLSVTQAIDTKSAHTLSNGASSLQCLKKVSSQTASQVEVPEMFGILIRPFKASAEAYSLNARFEYRVKDDGILMRFELIGLKDMMDSAFERIGDQVSAATSLPLYQQP